LNIGTLEHLHEHLCANLASASLANFRDKNKQNKARFFAAFGDSIVHP
jgi:hypothetical protein